MNSFVKQLGTQFTLDDQIFRVNAANNYYLGYSSDTMVEAVFDLASRMNINVLRTWAFLDCGAALPGQTPPGAKGDVFFQYWNSATGKPDFNDGPNGLKLLDRTIAMAEKKEIRLILPFVNYLEDFGGAPQYIQWFGLTGVENFFLNSGVKQAYKNYVEHLLLRVNTVTGRQYKDEPAIMAWELANEPRCPAPGSSDVLRAWVAEMTDWVKSLDPNHLVGVGDEGFLRREGTNGYLAYDGFYGVDCERLMGSPALDFGTCHLYPRNYSQEDDPVEFGRRWIQEHIEAGGRANKPMLIEEYGWRAEDGPQLRDDVFALWLDQVKSSEGAGAGLWMIASTRDDGERYPDYDKYTVYAPEEAMSVLDFGQS